MTDCIAPAPYLVDHTDHLWIEMADGVRLAARLWRPVTELPVPAILEYIPYRKADMVRARDERNHPFFAAHGYACIRVDMRGSGDSDGHMPDMYAPAELDDARQVIAWLAAQDWCNGRVGMFGTSWGGTAALQASVNAPDALKAVIAVCATHDRFEDDIHYMGGCVLSDTFEWGATLPAILASPPTPHVGADWKARWQDRLDTLSFPLENWLRERGRGAYWRHGSVRHQTSDLSVPILSVGGWSDRYSNSVMSLVDARPDLVWGVVGPWGHHYPDHGAPGPAIGFQHLALDWWSHWLKPDLAGDPDWPRLRVWLRELDPPKDTIKTRNGRWIETRAAAECAKPVSYDLSVLASGTKFPSDVPATPSIGQTSGDTGYFGRAGGLPLDQREDDARSLIFETPPLDADCILFGATEVALSGTFSGPSQIVARLSDVTPDDVVARIAYGIRNLALDDQLDRPTPPQHSGSFDVTLRLHTTAYRVRKGHRLRLALSNSLWPLICAQLQPGIARVSAGRLSLPVMTDKPVDLKSPLPAAEDLPKTKSHDVVAAPGLKRWRDITESGVEIGWHQPLNTVHYHEVGAKFGYETSCRHRLRTQSKPQETTEITHQMIYERPDGVATITVDLIAATENHVCSVDATLRAFWNGEAVARRNWHLKSTTPNGT
ncbi:MAG: CocE/NonD family hydrolase [Arenibacterium sp.]